MKTMIENTINKYLPNLDNIEVGKINIKGLPLYIKNLYGFEELLINGRNYLVINVKDKSLGPQDFKKHKKILKEKIDYPQIWYMKALHYHKIQRLIKNGINFIVEDKQVYLPVLNIAIKPEKNLIKLSTKKLNGLAINIMISQLLKDDVEGKNKRNIAKCFGVTEMTAGRAIERLIACDLCYEKKVGVSKYICFKEKQELWAYMAQNIPSPVREVVYINEKKDKLPISGITALAKETMLADDEIKTFAISKKAYKKSYSEKDLVFKEIAKFKLEIWSREPILIKNNSINPMDIFLVLKGEQDQRVQIELEALLKKHNLNTQVKDD